MGPSWGQQAGASQEAAVGPWDQSVAALLGAFGPWVQPGTSLEAVTSVEGGPRKVELKQSPGPRLKPPRPPHPHGRNSIQKSSFHTGTR